MNFESDDDTNLGVGVVAGCCWSITEAAACEDEATPVMASR